MASKDYSSIYNIKHFAMNELAPKFFNMDETNDLNIGLLGFVSEFIGTATEDSFNTISMYINEMFPHLALLPETIYNNASLFQLNGAFATASKCFIYLFISEDTIKMNEANLDRPVNGIYKFYLDSNMVIDVEGLQFKPDYDILIQYKRTINNEIVYNAEYVFKKYGSEYKNSISDLTTSNIRIKRVTIDNSNYIQLEIQAHQVEKFVQEETITFNDIITTPTVVVPFTGKIANFEVFYKKPGDLNYTQLSKRLYGTPPTDKEFCYYKMVDEGELELSFTTRDGYFQPEYNGDLLIEYYTTSGSEGNFEAYTGSETAVYLSSDIYQYNNSIAIYAIPVSSAVDGSDSLSLSQLQTETVEMFSTVGSYTNENDLQIYFNKYNNKYNSNILFLKTRDDIFERKFSAFSLLKNNDDEIFSTNTLDLLGMRDDNDNDPDVNSSEFDEVLEQSNILILKPGHIFTYKEDLLEIDFHKDKSVYEIDGNIDIIGIDKIVIRKSDEAVSITDYNYNPYTHKLTLNISDENILTKYNGGKITIYESQYQNSVKKNNKDLIKYAEVEVSEKNKFIYTNPFLLYFRKNPIAIGYYLNSVKSTHRLSSVTIPGENPLKHVNQFVCSNLTVTRNAIGPENSNKYIITVTVTPSTAPETKMLKEPDPANSSSVYESYVKLQLVFTDNNGNDRCWKEMEFDTENYDDNLRVYRYKCEIETDDVINDEEFFYIKGETEPNKGDGVSITNIKNAENFYYPGYGCPVPMTNSIVKICTYYDDEKAAEGLITPLTTLIDDNMLTNTYSTELDPISFIIPLNMINSVGEYVYLGGGVLNETTGEITDDLVNTDNVKRYSINIHSFPLVKAETMADPDVAMDFYRIVRIESDYLSNAMDKLTNNFSMDIRFYNTYGRSKNFYIDRELTNMTNELTNIDKVNISIRFQINVTYGLDTVVVINEIKNFIKNYIEGINEKGTNSIYISNLIRELENKFSYINYIKFVGIDEYGCEVQSIENKTIDLTTLTKSERVKYIPEYLTLSVDDINIDLI